MAKYLKTEEGYKSFEELDIGSNRKIEELIEDVSVQADMNELNPESLGYIKNKTHWMQTKRIDPVQYASLEAPENGWALISNGIHPVYATYDPYYALRYHPDDCTFGNAVSTFSFDPQSCEHTSNEMQMVFRSVRGFYITVKLDKDEERAYVKSEDLIGSTILNYYNYQDLYFPLNESFIPNTIARAADKLDKENPVGTGTFSMNRLADTTIGTHSFAEGYRGTASGAFSHAEGNSTISSGGSSHSEGYGTKASGAYAHAEGQKTVATNKAQHAQGEFNIIDNTGTSTTRGKYAHIVGNGTADTSRSNAHTLDWNGLGWFAGGPKVGGTSQDDAEAKEVATKDDIPTDEHINDLINTALGVIENGTY